MKRVFLALALLSALAAGGCLRIEKPLGSVNVEGGKSDEARIRALEQRVDALDARVQALEAPRTPPR